MLVFNKLDLLDPTRPAPTCCSADPGAIGVSAETGEGIDELRDAIEAAFADTLEEVDLLVPYAEGGRLSELHELAGDLEREERSDGVLVHARIPRSLAAPVRRVRGRRRRPEPRWSSASSDCSDAAPPADARPRRRRRPRPLRRRGRDPRRPGGRVDVGTGIAVEIPPGHAGLVLPRSGSARNARHHPRQRTGPDRRRLPRRVARADA